MTQPPVSWEEHQRALEEDYSQYVAVTAIFVDGALAYRTGDPVPATNVKTYDYESNGLVKKAGTKAAAVARGDEKK
jgi:hypothetical protein